MTTKKPETIDDYIAAFPEATQHILHELRDFIREKAPNAGEKISYGMPTFTLNGTYLVYFAGYKNHIGLYPAPVDAAEFAKELSHYKTGRGSVQFPLNKPLPYDLIGRIIDFRLETFKTANL
jgi:uncharacterized protein YdhG (YjbR/CyaY superfamily)